MNAGMRKVGILCMKDLVDMLKNPSMLCCLLFPIGFSVLFRFLTTDMRTEALALAASDAARQQVIDTISTLLLASSLCMTIGMIVSMAVVYGIAEEKEKHTLRTLMLSNVSATQIALSRALVTLGVVLVVSVACYLVLAGGDFGLLPAYLALGLLGAAPLVLVSLVLGLAARDQMTAGLYSMPIVLVALAPVFGMQNEAIEGVVQLAPTGGMFSLFELAVSGELFTAQALVPLAIIVAWTVGGAVVFSMLYKKLAQDN